MAGIYLNPENCNTESLDLTALPVEKKSSVFHLSYKDHTGALKTTETKAWINDFQVDKETNIGKCDFNFELKIDLEDGPTVEFRDWLL